MAARLTASGLTAHPLRATLHRLVQEAGCVGARLTHLVRQTGAARNTVEYHLFLFIRKGVMERRQRNGGSTGTRYVLANLREATPTMVAAREVQEHRLSAILLNEIRKRPGSPVVALATSTGIHPSHAMYWLRKMVAAKLIMAEKTSRARRIYPLPRPELGESHPPLNQRS